MANVTVLGNISIDIYFHGDSLTFFNNRFQLAVGGKYFADGVSISVGGSGANVSIGLSKNGVHASVVGALGQNPFRKMIIEAFERHNVDISHCEEVAHYYNISSILLSSKGDRTIIHYTTPHHQHIFARKSDYQLLKRSDAVFFGNHPDVPLEEKREILDFLHDHQILTFFNIGVVDCRRKKETIMPLLQKANVIILNGHEFADLVKAQYKDIHFRENVIHWYAPELQNQLVVITDGSKGSYAYQQGKVFHQSAIRPALIVDTTGAGDAFSSAFVAEFLRSKDIKRAMEKGSHFAARILSKMGAN